MGVSILSLEIATAVIIAAITVAQLANASQYEALMKFLEGDVGGRASKMKKETRVHTVQQLDEWFRQDQYLLQEVKKGGKLRPGGALVVNDTPLGYYGSIKQTPRDAVIVNALISSSKLCGNIEIDGGGLEEDLCRRTTLYGSVSPKFNPDFFSKRGGMAIAAYGQLPGDMLVYSPLVSIIASTDQNVNPEFYLEPMDVSGNRAVSVISTMTEDCGSPVTGQRLELIRKISAQLMAALQHRKSHVYVNPLTCGGVDRTAELASVFKEVILSYAPYFKSIVLAIPDYEEFELFQKAYKKYKPPTKPLEFAPHVLNEAFLANVGFAETDRLLQEAVQYMRSHLNTKWMRPLPQVTDLFDTSAPSLRHDGKRVIRTTEISAIDEMLNTYGKRTLLISSINTSSPLWAMVYPQEVPPVGGGAWGNGHVDRLAQRTLAALAFDRRDFTQATELELGQGMDDFEMPYVFVDNVPVVRDAQNKLLTRSDGWGGGRIAVLLSPPLHGDQTVALIKGLLMAAIAERRTDIFVAPFITGANGGCDIPNDRNKGPKNRRFDEGCENKVKALAKNFMEALKDFKGYFDSITFAIEGEKSHRAFKLGAGMRVRRMRK